MEIGKIDTPNTPIYNLLFACLGAGSEINSGGVDLFVWAQTFNWSIVSFSFIYSNIFIPIDTTSP